MLRVSVHTDHPQGRRLRPVVDALQDGGILAWPSNSGYVLSCLPASLSAAERMRRNRGLKPNHHLTLICNNQGELGKYGHLDTPTFRLISSLNLKDYTFIMHATREVPRQLRHPKRRTIGLKVAGNVLGEALLQMVGGALLTTSAIPKDGTSAVEDPNDLSCFRFEALLDGGIQRYRPSTVVDLTERPLRIIRSGEEGKEIGDEEFQL